MIVLDGCLSCFMKDFINDWMSNHNFFSYRPKINVIWLSKIVVHLFLFYHFHKWWWCVNLVYIRCWEGLEHNHICLNCTWVLNRIFVLTLIITLIIEQLIYVSFTKSFSKSEVWEILKVKISGLTDQLLCVQLLHLCIQVNCI